MSLDLEFETRLRESVNDSIALGYNPAQFAEMLERYGGVDVAKRLVASGELQDGLKRIVALGHIELAMESIMLEPRFAPLFSEGELAAARWRLAQLT